MRALFFLAFLAAALARAQADPELPKHTLFYDSVGGVGAMFDSEGGSTVVHALVTGGAAEKAGLKRADKIVRVDDKAVAGLKLPQVVALIRGPEGTLVKLTVEREGRPATVTIKREMMRFRHPNSEVDPRHT